MMKFDTNQPDHFRCRAELEGEITLLKQRLYSLDELGDSSYERRLARAYRELLEEHRRRLELLVAA